MLLLPLLVHLLIQLILFGLAFMFSANLRPPRRLWVWIALLAVVFGLGYVGTTTSLIEVPGMALHVNDVLQPIGFGVLGQLIVRDHALAGGRNDESSDELLGRQGR